MQASRNLKSIILQTRQRLGLFSYTISPNVQSSYNIFAAVLILESLHSVSKVLSLLDYRSYIKYT